MIQPKERACSRCRVAQPPDHFSRDASRIDGLSKWCKSCVATKSREHYERNRDRVLARQAAQRSEDPERFKAISKASRERHPETHRARARRRYETHREEILAANKARHRFKRFGLTPEAFDALLAKQGGACAVCRTTEAERWHVDHDRSCCPTIYTCGKCIRGILCHTCNVGIGFLRDDPSICERAATYLRSS